MRRRSCKSLDASCDSTPRCESKPLTAPDESAFSAIASGHRHFGVLAPNSLLRPAVTALAPIASARGPPLWQVAGAEPDPSADQVIQSDPSFEFDQRVTW